MLGTMLCAEEGMVRLGYDLEDNFPGIPRVPRTHKLCPWPKLHGPLKEVLLRDEHGKEAKQGCCFTILIALAALTV